MLDKSMVESKKKSFGLAALVVLCLATVFLAGAAYNSSATASLVKAGYTRSQPDYCSSRNEWDWYVKNHGNSMEDYAFMLATCML